MIPIQGSIPGWGTKIPHAEQHSQKLKKKKRPGRTLTVTCPVPVCMQWMGKAVGHSQAFSAIFPPKDQRQKFRVTASVISHHSGNQHSSSSAVAQADMTTFQVLESTHHPLSIVLIPGKRPLPLGQRVWRASRDGPAQSLSHPPHHTLNTQDQRFPVPFQDLLRPVLCQCHSPRPQGPVRGSCLQGMWTELGCPYTFVYVYVYV